MLGPLALFHHAHPSRYFPSTMLSWGFGESCWLALFTILITAKDFLPAVGWIMVGSGGGGPLWIGASLADSCPEWRTLMPLCPSPPYPTGRPPALPGLLFPQWAFQGSRYKNHPRQARFFSLKKKRKAGCLEQWASAKAVCQLVAASRARHIQPVVTNDNKDAHGPLD